MDAIWGMLRDPQTFKTKCPKCEDELIGILSIRNHKNCVNVKKVDEEVISLQQQRTHLWNEYERYRMMFRMVLMKFRPIKENACFTCPSYSEHVENPCTNFTRPQMYETIEPEFTEPVLLAFRVYTESRNEIKLREAISLSEQALKQAMEIVLEKLKQVPGFCDGSTASDVFPEYGVQLKCVSAIEKSRLEEEMKEEWNALLEIMREMNEIDSREMREKELLFDLMETELPWNKWPIRRYFNNHNHSYQVEHVERAGLFEHYLEVWEAEAESRGCRNPLKMFSHDPRNRLDGLPREVSALVREWDAQERQERDPLVREIENRILARHNMSRDDDPVNVHICLDSFKWYDPLDTELERYLRNYNTAISWYHILDRDIYLHHSNFQESIASAIEKCDKNEFKAVVTAHSKISGILRNLRTFAYISRHFLFKMHLYRGVVNAPDDYDTTVNLRPNMHMEILSEHYMTSMQAHIQALNEDKAAVQRTIGRCSIEKMDKFKDRNDYWNFILEAHVLIKMIEGYIEMDRTEYVEKKLHQMDFCFEDVIHTFRTFDHRRRDPTDHRRRHNDTYNPERLN